MSNEQMTLFDIIDSEVMQKSSDWKWSFKDYPPKNGLKVFSCFACGGGSTMGYKLAGCEVLGCCEIDPRMNKVYIENHHPKYNYLMDIRDFNKLDDLPSELYDLDILDGSPPCSTFSMAGQREKNWGKEKKFREGQKKQTLDDLLFVFIDTVAKLKPKVVVMENVEGLLVGNATKYVREVCKRFNKIGYKCIFKLLCGEHMGVPQTRHRVFFIATRLDFDLLSLDLKFNYAPVLYKDIRTGDGEEVSKDSRTMQLLNDYRDGEKCLEDAYKRLTGKTGWFQAYVLNGDDMMPTIRAATVDIFRRESKRRIDQEDIINAQTFPQDFNFLNQKVGYICGMSVPPLMIKRIVNRLIESGIFGCKE